jgi:hypothetical protein
MKTLVLLVTLILGQNSYAMGFAGLDDLVKPYVNSIIGQNNLNYYLTKARGAKKVLGSKMSHIGKRKTILVMANEARSFANMNSYIGSFAKSYIADIETLVKQYRYGAAIDKVDDLISTMEIFANE